MWTPGVRTTVSEPIGLIFGDPQPRVRCGHHHVESPQGLRFDVQAPVRADVRFHALEQAEARGSALVQRVDLFELSGEPLRREPIGDRKAA